MKNIILRFWSMRKEFVKYFIIGISAFISDVGSLYVLKEWVGLTPTVAVIINQPAITYLVFYFNKRWSFQAEGLTSVQMVRFYILAGFNYVFSIIWIKVMHDQLGVQYIIARTANIALAVTWNFLLYKYWVYRVAYDQNMVEKKAGNVAS